ncbi:MAG TPA: hypothetical protein VFA45_14210 [Actinomycetes bacterium]|jgi:hypothetical protein|nr:hypothetical protein [Actinomycetes bacterium]
MDDGTGRVNPALTPLFAALTSMDKPRAGLIWLQNPKVPKLLSDLATGHIPLTHEGLHAAPSWRTAAYLRDLLMTWGVLPTIDKQLLHYEALLYRRLADLADADRRAAPARPPGPSTRRRPGAGLPPPDHHPGRDRGRNALGPLRRRRPQQVASTRVTGREYAPLDFAIMPVVSRVEVTGPGAWRSYSSRQARPGRSRCHSDREANMNKSLRGIADFRALSPKPLAVAGHPSCGRRD